MDDKKVREIEKQAKEILDKFSKALDKVDTKEESNVLRDVDRREEGKDERCEIDRKIMFENAPNKNKDFIIAEKKKW